jgi:hypothetical protein
MNLDYEAMTEYYVDIIRNISDIIYNTKQKYEKDSEEYTEIESSYLEWYASKEKAYYRIIRILDMKEYYTNDDFQYWALEKCSEARHRIQRYIEDATKLLDFTNINYTKYDSIVMDYFQPIRLNFDEECEKKKRKEYNKYDSIQYRKTIINNGLVFELENVKEAIQDSKDLSENEKKEQYLILNNIMELTKKLKGYDERLI